MRRFLLAAATLALTLPAHAATIGGAYQVDPTRSVTALSSYSSGTFTTSSHTYTQLGALPNNWGGLYNGTPAADRRLNFTGAPDPTGPNPTISLQATFASPLVNVAGYDLLMFESGEPFTSLTSNPLTDPLNNEIEYVSASLTGAAGTWFDLDVLDFLTESEVGGTRTDRGVYVLALDLSLFGLAEGATISSLFFGNSASGLDHDPDIVYAAGIAVTPLPGALPLFGGGLSLMSFFGWWKRKKAIAAA